MPFGFVPFVTFWSWLSLVIVFVVHRATKFTTKVKITKNSVKFCSKLNLGGHASDTSGTSTEDSEEEQDSSRKDTGNKIMLSLYASLVYRSFYVLVENVHVEFIHTARSTNQGLLITHRHFLFHKDKVSNF